MLQQSHEESRLNAYLDTLEKPLASLGEAARQDWRQEAEGHLLDLIAAHEELGSSHEEAVTLALRQFGDTQRIGKNVAQEVRRQKYRIPREEIKRASFSYMPAVIGVLGVTFLGMLYVSDTTLLVHEWIHVGVIYLFILLPLLSGWIRGQLQNRRILWATTLGHIIYGFLMGILHATLFELLPGVEAMHSFPAGFGAVCYCFLPLIAAWMRQRFDNRQRAKI